MGSLKKMLVGICITVVAIGVLCYFSFCKFASGVKEDLKTHYPKKVKLNDSITLVIQQPGKTDTIRTKK